MFDGLITPTAAFLDDVVIYSKDWDYHLDKIAAVLQLMREAGLVATRLNAQQEKRKPIIWANPHLDG